MQYIISDNINFYHLCGYILKHYPAMPLIINKMNYSYVYRIILRFIIKNATIYCILPHSK